MECEYCKQILKTPAALKKHQNTAKYCLSKQNKAPPEEHLCFFCGTRFTVKSSLHSHLKICKANTPVIQEQLHLFEQSKKDLESSLLREKELIATYEKKITKNCIEYEKIIEDLKTEIEDYKDKMFILASKPTHNNINTNINNIECQTIVEIEEETDTSEQSTNESYELVPLEIDNGYIIESRDSDGYIDVTNLCIAGKKKFNDWNRLDKTKAFLKELSSSAGIPAVELIT